MPSHIKTASPSKSCNLVAAIYHEKQQLHCQRKLPDTSSASDLLLFTSGTDRTSNQMPGSSDTETMVSTAQRQFADTTVDHEFYIPIHSLTELI